MLSVSANVSGKSQQDVKRRYYCSVENEEATIVMHLSAVDQIVTKHIPTRYALVIDISGSMEQTFGNDPRSLLERIKIFVKLFIDKVSTIDSISVVAFDNVAEVVYKMNVMTKTEKQNAMKAVSRLKPRGATDLSAGLLTGLSACGKGSSSSRDCIILFTDGIANEGIIEADQLIDTYHETTKKLKRESCVPISAFTIGGYHPYLLIEIAANLGSDAFYWLNDGYDFEADLLIPMFLRETTHITDVNIDFTSLNGVTIKPHGSDKRTEFIHALPEQITRTQQLSLTLPHGRLTEINDKTILDIQISYLDFNMNRKTVNDIIILHVRSLQDCKMDYSKNKAVLQQLQADFSQEKIDYLKLVSAYVSVDGKEQLTWRGAQQSVVEIGKENCTAAFQTALQESSQKILDKEFNSAVEKYDEALDSIEKVANNVSHVFDEKNDKKYVSFKKFYQTIKEEIVEAQDICKLAEFDSRTFPRIAAMESSVSTNMPTAGGVFKLGRKQRNMPSSIQKKLEGMRRAVAKKKKDDPFGTSGVFKANYFVLSERLRDKRVGNRNETVKELIVRCRGTPVPNVNTMSINTVMVASNADYRRKSGLVRDALASQIPIVKEKFLYDSIEQRKMLDMDKYILKNNPKKANAV